MQSRALMLPPFTLYSNDNPQASVMYAIWGEFYGTECACTRDQSSKLWRPGDLLLGGSIQTNATAYLQDQ